jgi:phasin family protein
VLANKTLENVMRLVDLNMKLTKDSMQDSAAAAQQWLSAKTPQEFFSLSAGKGQLNLEKILSYDEEVASIPSSMQAELSKAAQAQFADSCHRASTLVEQMASSAPADAQNPFAIMKSAIEKVSGGYEQWATMSKQVTETMEANRSMATNQFASARKKAASPVKKGNEQV